MIEIKEENVEKMLVWDREDDEPIERFVICKMNNYYWAVYDADDKSFLNKSNIKLTKWQHAKPLPKEKWRPFKPEEIDPLLLKYIARSKTFGYIAAIQGIKNVKNTDDDDYGVMIGAKWYTLEAFFDYFEISNPNLINWQPAGVKE